jgi:hypothetical protein
MGAMEGRHPPAVVQAAPVGVAATTRYVTPHSRQGYFGTAEVEKVPWNLIRIIPA